MIFYLFLNMVQPKFLKTGDTVALLSTARKISLDEIQPAIDLLNAWGLKVLIGKSITASDHQFAGNDELRAKDFQMALDNNAVKAIWCARGGYGTVRIIDRINFSKFKLDPKWIIGYSDITVLHSHVHQLAVKTIHATMPINVSKNTKNSLNSLKNTLFGQFLAQNAPFSQLNRVGKCTGIVTGGNLSILYSLLGSSSSIDTKDKVLFIEDLDEYVYHIDRMIQALKRTGMLSQLRGLIVGGMTEMRDNEIPFGKTAQEIIRQAVDEYNYPVCFDFPAGHLDNNTALVMGNEVGLEVRTKGTVLTINV